MSAFDWRPAQRRLGVVDDGIAGPATYAALIAAVGQRAPTPLIRALASACVEHFPKAGITTPLRIAHNLAQACVETARFSQMVESLNYSVDGLVGGFGRHRISLADAQRLGRKNGEGPLSQARQEAIANILYGGDWGRANLGNTALGDGWRYRGRGWKQCTGRGNYAMIEAATTLSVIDNPDMLADPDKGVLAAVLFWDARGCNALADRDDIALLTRRVNGGDKGLPERIAACARAKKILM